MVEPQAQAYKGAVPPWSALVLRDELGTGFPKAMEEELEHPLLGMGKPLVLTPIAMEDHRSKRKPLEDLGAWGVEQERDLCICNQPTDSKIRMASY